MRRKELGTDRPTPPGGCDVIEITYSNLHSSSLEGILNKMLALDFVSYGNSSSSSSGGLVVTGHRRPKVQGDMPLPC